MSNTQLEQALQAWPVVARALHVPHNETEYSQLVRLLDHLIDEVGEDEKHPHASLMEILAVLIQMYEDEHVAELSES